MLRKKSINTNNKEKFYFILINLIIISYQLINIDNLINIPDSVYYYNISIGKFSEVIKPFSYRFLYPYLAYTKIMPSKFHFSII